jgi:multidrug efflux pump subunit AcrB
VKAMREVSGLVIMIALILCAVFAPVAFIGLGSLSAYQQFAITVAVAVVFSAINALTLSPLDREKARAFGVKVKSVFQTLQAYLSED